mmetsp:Transcript_67079/g.187647  ORF Transcript_67079/g.187647 Transcript_67079/m.187647 type:complete len:217 (-) Transcript_67079:136-786(-)
MFFHQQFHTQLFVEFERLFGIFDSHHGLRKVAFVGDFSGRASCDQFHPVTIRILHKRQALHSTFVWLFLKVASSLFQLVRHGVHIINIDSHMTKSILFFVPCMIGKVSICFCTMIMSQFQRHSLHGPQVIMGLLSPWCQVICLALGQSRQKVEAKPPLGKVKFVNQGETQQVRIKWQSLGGVLDSQHRLLPGRPTGDNVCGCHSQKGCAGGGSRKG